MGIAFVFIGATFYTLLGGYKVIDKYHTFKNISETMHLTNVYFIRQILLQKPLHMKKSTEKWLKEFQVKYQDIMFSGASIWNLLRFFL